MRLYLCRHAEAVDEAGDPSIDEDRWLTAHGREQAVAVGHALRKHDVEFDRLFTSPLVRAVQTAEGLATGLKRDKPVETLRSLAPGGRLGKVLELLEQQTNEDDHVALVGHEPMMSEWAAKLLGQPFSHAFKKGAVLCVEWDGWPEAGTGKAVFFLTPKSMKPEPL